MSRLGVDICESIRIEPSGQKEDGRGVVGRYCIVIGYDVYPIVLHGPDLIESRQAPDILGVAFKEAVIDIFIRPDPWAHGPAYDDLRILGEDPLSLYLAILEGCILISRKAAGSDVNTSCHLHQLVGCMAGANSRSGTHGPVALGRALQVYPHPFILGDLPDLILHLVEDGVVPLQILLCPIPCTHQDSQQPDPLSHVVGALAAALTIESQDLNLRGKLIVQRLFRWVPGISEDGIGIGL